MHEQHAEAFAFVLIEVLVVHFVRPANGTYVGAVAPAEPFKPLVNDDVMHDKISRAI